MRQRAQQYGIERDALGQAQLGRHEVQQEQGEHIEGDVAAQPRAEGDQQLLLVVAQHFHDRRARFRMRFLELLEHPGFTHVGADVEADADQQRRQQERHAPAPAEEGFFRNLPGHQREHAVGQQQADRRRQLHQAAEDAAPLSFRVQLVDHDRRPAPLAAQRQALHHAQQHQQHRRQRARGGIGRQQADAEGGQAHHQQRDDQDRLAAHLVAEVAKDRRTQRPRHEGHAVAGKG